MCRELLLSLVPLVLAAAQLSICHGQLGLNDAGMQSAVDKLSSMFYEIRNEGLGIDALEEAFRTAQYIPSSIADEEIRDLLTDDSFSNNYNSILELFDNVSSIALSPGVVSTTSVVPCCDSQAGTASVCGYTPGSVNLDIAEVLADFDVVPGVQVQFGGIDGSIIRVPSQAPPADCAVEDSRLQPWFVPEARKGSRPMEVVLLLNLVADPTGGDGRIMTTAEDQETVRRAAELVIRSLPSTDMIGAVGLGRSNTLSPVNARLSDTGSPKVVPVCLDTILESESFLASLTSPTNTATLRDINYEDGFQRALDLFSNSADTEKRLLYFTLGSTQQLLSEGVAVMNRINAGPDDLTVSVYTAKDDLFSVLEDDIATNGVAGVTVLEPPAMLPGLVGEYYSISSNITPSENVRLGRDNSEEQGNVLTLARPIFDNNTEFVGVVYAVLPFKVLLADLFEFTRTRPYSYAFVLDQDRCPLYHPLLPGEIVEDISILNLEPEGVITGYLDSNSMSSVPVNKEHLLYGGNSDRHSYISHAMPSTYWCNSPAVEGASSFSVCLVLADEERTLYTLDLDRIDVEAIYRTQEPPVYHNVLLRADQSIPLCNYFCKHSISNRLSFQLTTPSSPGSMDTLDLVTELTGYIKGTGPLPGNVQRGVAEEAALGVAVSSAWLNTSSTPNDFITRRHLATPSGLYLTYPPTHLVSSFNPTASEWYLYSSARRTPITITPPHLDPLVEGRSLTVSIGYAIRNPTSQNDQDPTRGRPSAVVSGEVTLEALRVFVRKALPLCESFRGSEVECLIVDETGNLIYERVNEHMDGVGRFFGYSVTRLRSIVSGLGSLIAKKQCASLFNSLEKMRRFHNLDITMEGAVRGSAASGCGEFVVQLIPGTNAFFIVYETRNCENIICLCSSATCINCQDFSDSCECPCNCLEDCKPLTTNIPVCPVTPSVDPNYFIMEAGPVRLTDSLCFNQTCNCRANFDSCSGVRDCYWCKAEGKCVQNTECCDPDVSNCCGNDVFRFTPFRETCFLLSEHCLQNPRGFFNVTCPRLSSSSSQTSIIVAIVIGVIIGGISISLIVVLIIYYQFFRKADPSEETSRESAFDFSNKTAMMADGKRKGSKTQSVSDSEKGTAEVENQKELTPPKEKDETTL